MKKKLKVAKSSISYEMDYFVNDEVYVTMSFVIIGFIGFVSFLTKFN